MVKTTTAVFNLEAGENLNNILGGFTINVTVAVNWIGFDGENVGNKNHLMWSVSDERNISHYEIERSNNGNTFILIGKQLTIDNFEVSSYNFDDYNIENDAQYYYRIKQVDTNGTFNYSSIISVKSSVNESIAISLFPNPAVNQITLELYLSSPEEVTIKIHRRDRK